MTVDFNALTNSLTTIVQTIDASSNRASSATGSLLDAFGVIDLILWGAWMVFGMESLGSVFKKFLSLQLWLWIIRGFQLLAKALMKTLVAGGFAAGGQSGGGLSTLLDPSKIAGLGMKATLPLAQKIDEVSVIDVGTIVLMGLILVIITGCFILIAVNVAIAVIEFYIFLNLAGLLMPFALLPQTRFLADKAINAVIAATLKLTVYAFVLALIQPILTNVEFHKDFGLKLGLNWNDIFAMMMVVLFCLFLSIKAPSLAAGLIHGSPTLSGSGMVMGAAAMALAGATQLTQAAGQGLAGGVGWAANKLSELGNRIPPKADSAMSAASRAGNMSGSASASPWQGGGAPGAMFVAAYYPASNQLQEPDKPALPENIIDAPADDSGGPAALGPGGGA